jgi:hypothetical protein
MLLHKLPTEIFLFSAETQVIFYEATILPNTITSNDILILSDSLSALLGLQNLQMKSPKISKILKSTFKKIIILLFYLFINYVGTIHTDLPKK